MVLLVKWILFTSESTNKTNWKGRRCLAAVLGKKGTGKKGTGKKRTGKERTKKKAHMDGGKSASGKKRRYN